MKFLVFTKPKNAVNHQLPSAARFRDQQEWFRKGLATGQIESAYHGINHAVFIVQAESLDRLEKWIDQIPLHELIDSEVEPLSDLFEHMEGVSAFLENAEREALVAVPSSAQGAPAGAAAHRTKGSRTRMDS